MTLWRAQMLPADGGPLLDIDQVRGFEEIR